MSLSINPNFSTNTKKNAATVGTVAAAGAGAVAVSKYTKGKSFALNTAINKPLKQFASSEKTFLGSEFLKSMAGKIGKTSTRQKLLSTLAVGTLAAVMGIREHFAKEHGKELVIDKFNKILRTKNAHIDKQSDRIANLEADLMFKDSVIDGYKKTLSEVDRAAQNIGVDKDLAQELLKQTQK